VFLFFFLDGGGLKVIGLSTYFRVSGKSYTVEFFVALSKWIILTSMVNQAK